MKQFKLFTFFEIATAVGAIATTVTTATGTSFAIANIVLFALILISSIRRASCPTTLFVALGFLWPLIFAFSYSAAVIEEAPMIRGRLYSPHGPAVFFSFVAVFSSLAALAGGAVGFGLGALVTEIGSRFGLWTQPTEEAT